MFNNSSIYGFEIRYEIDISGAAAAQFVDGRIADNEVVPQNDVLTAIAEKTAKVRVSIRRLILIVNPRVSDGAEH
jgi:hypothetical protein